MNARAVMIKLSRCFKGAPECDAWPMAAKLAEREFVGRQNSAEVPALRLPVRRTASGGPTAVDASFDGGYDGERMTEGGTHRNVPCLEGRGGGAVDSRTIRE